MNDHLSEQQVMDWLLSEPPAATRTHLESCAECASRVARLQAPIESFRKAATSWSEQKAVVHAHPMNWSRRPHMRPFTTALVWASGLLVIAGMSTPLLLHRGVVEQPVAQHSAGTPQSAAGAAASGSAVADPNGKSTQTVESASLRARDAVLLEQVDDDVSQFVPQAMAPLTVLVSWSDSESSTAGEPPSGTEVQKKSVQQD